MPNRSPLVLTDFPGPTGRAERCAFTNPIEVIVAAHVGEVLPAIERVERAAKQGRWAVGFVAYGAGPAFDPALRIAGEAATPLLWFGIFNKPEPGLPTLPRSAGRLQIDDATDRELSTGPWTPDVDRLSYDNAICEIQDGIRDGTFYQVNYTLRLQSPGITDPVVAYESLHAAQPDGYGMYVDTGRFQVLSASPELFFERSGRDIRTRPMKGTARRGRWTAEDAAAAAALAASPKDRAENIMIVDLLRSDLGRIAEVGTVAVPQLFAVERHPTLWQMTSTITATLRADAQLPEIFRALFPCGSVVGAPKVSAAAWIAEHEASPRGVYCGAMGIVRPGGDCVFNVAIRTAVIDQETGTTAYGAGGAITIDSTSAGEFDELLAKAAVLAGPAADFELLETLRLVDGAYVRGARHLRRLAASADYFGFGPVTDGACAALDAQARTTPTGHHRVRLLMSRDRVARTEAVAIDPPPARGPTALRCRLARSPVSSRDRFLFHKTTHRRIFDERRAECPDVDEVILWNERGELTECTIGNLVVELDGERVTPPQASGLLAGVFREELLERGMIIERALTRDDLSRASALWLINSLREWVPLALC